MKWAVFEIDGDALYVACMTIWHDAFYVAGVTANFFYSFITRFISRFS